MILLHWRLTEKADRFVNVTYYFYIIYWMTFNQTRMELKPTLLEIFWNSIQGEGIRFKILMILG